MLICFQRFINKVSILDGIAITSPFTDVSLNIPDTESVSRPDITIDPVGHWKDSSTISKSISNYFLSSSESSSASSSSPSSPNTSFNISFSVITPFELWTSLSKSTKLSAELPWSRGEFLLVSSSSCYLRSINGSSESLIASTCDVAEILAFLEQFTIAKVNTWFQALVRMYMPSRMLNLGIALLLSKAVMMQQTRMVWYFAFKLQITPWFISWVMEVVFFLAGKQQSYILDSQYVDVLGNCQWS